jgi:hypothetical protein
MHEIADRIVGEGSRAQPVERRRIGDRLGAQYARTKIV